MVYSKRSNRGAWIDRTLLLFVLNGSHFSYVAEEAHLRIFHTARINGVILSFHSF